MSRATRLTKRQLQTLRKVARSRSRIPSNRQLAKELGIAVRTVEHYLTRYLRKPATRSIIPTNHDEYDDLKLDSMMFKRLLQLCHPDKHMNSEAAKKATQWLLENRK
jgi:DNA-binding CsgD family transcriptional regulator